MSLADLLGDALDLLAGGVIGGPSTDRGQLRLLTVLGGAGGTVSAWLFIGSSDPVRTVSWAVGALALATSFGAVGILLSLLHLVRYRSEAGWAVTCLVVNVIAVSITWLPQAF